MKVSETEDSMKWQWRGFNAALTVMIISAPFLVLRIFGSGFFVTGSNGEDRLPVSIRATAQADYSQDSQNFAIPPISENILNEIITNVPATYSAQDRMATLQANLSSPVPTMTIHAQAGTTTPTLFLQTPADAVTSPTSTNWIPPTATATPRVQSTPTTAPENTPRPTLPIPTATTLPTLVPTNLPLPTLPPLLPTNPPLLPTLPPILPTLPLPTIPPLLPTLSLPTIPPLLPTLPPILPTLPTLFP